MTEASIYMILLSQVLGPFILAVIVHVAAGRKYAKSYRMLEKENFTWLRFLKLLFLPFYYAGYWSFDKDLKENTKTPKPEKWHVYKHKYDVGRTIFTGIILSLIAHLFFSALFIGWRMIADLRENIYASVVYYFLGGIAGVLYLVFSVIIIIIAYILLVVRPKREFRKIEEAYYKTFYPVSDF